MNFTIVIPVLNEAATLPRLAAQLGPLAQRGVEVVIVDGGSSDDTVRLAKQAGFRVFRSAPGRAVQMNAGAARSTGDVLIFLHADTELPPDALARIAAHLDSGYEWGRFDVTIVGTPVMLRVVATMMNWRSRLTGIATGDQAIFMTRNAYDAVRGFPDQPLMEDIEISRRLRSRSRPACLRARVATSGRRWESRGVWRTIFLMWRLRWAYWRGRPARELAEAYR